MLKISLIFKKNLDFEDVRLIRIKNAKFSMPNF